MSSHYENTMVSSPVLGTGEEERYQTLCGEMMMSKEAVLVKIVALSAWWQTNQGNQISVVTMMEGTEM